MNVSAITAAQLKAIAGPGAKSDLVSAIVRGWPAAVQHAGLTSKNRACHFLAEIMTETGGLRILSESGAYSASRISQIFGVGKHSAKVTPAEAARIAALPVAQRGPVLFDRVYGPGNPTKAKEFNNRLPGDGWKYRGGGMMQATGKNNYAAMAKKTGLPLVDQPELLHDPDSAFMAAYLEWAQDGRCNAAADRDDVAAVRKIINGGSNGLAECRKFLAKSKKVLADYQASPVAAILSGPVPPDAIDSVDAGLLAVQKRLKAMNYNPGIPTGIWGGMTAGAVAGFINDRGGFVAAPTSAETFDAVSDEIKGELDQAESESFVRPVTEARSTADAETVAQVAPEVVPVKRSFLATAWASVVAFFAAIWDTVSGYVSQAWDFFTDHKDDVPTDSGIVSTAWGYVTSVPVAVWLALAGAGLAFVALDAWRATKKITTSVQTGARQ